MGEGGRRDGHGIDQRKELFQFVATEGFHAMLRGQDLGARLVEVIYADKFNPFGLFVLVGVITAKNTGARDAYTQNFSHNTLFRRYRVSA